MQRVARLVRVQGVEDAVRGAVHALVVEHVVSANSMFIVE